MAVARHVYIGEVKSISILNADCPGSGPKPAFQWQCSCGETNSTMLAKRHPGSSSKYAHYTNKLECERALDKHLESHDTRHREVTKDEAAEDAPTDDPIIAAHGAPSLITRGDRVLGVGGTMWMGKRGRVVGIGNFDDHPEAAKGQDRLRVMFEDEIDVPAHSFMPIGEGDARAHEDDQDAIERPPTRDASHDVRHAVPSSQGIDESDQTIRLIAIIDAPLNPGVGTMRYVHDRWDLFTEEELELIIHHMSNSCKTFGRDAGNIVREARENFRKR